LNRPVGHIPRVVKGDALQTIPTYVDDNKHLVVAMLYLDFDLYEPTKKAIETFLPRMPKGAIVAFDELNQSSWPGETLAVLDSVGIRNLRIRRLLETPALSYAILDWPRFKWSDGLGPNLGTGPFNELGSGSFEIVDVRHLVDKAGNPSKEVAEAVEAGALLLKRGRSVVVACDFGISRSNSIAAGIISVVDGTSLDEVVAATKESEIKIDMIESVRRALNPDRTDAERTAFWWVAEAGSLGAIYCLRSI
jgi:hypothetical protein